MRQSLALSLTRAGVMLTSLLAPTMAFAQRVVVSGDGSGLTNTELRATDVSVAVTNVSATGTASGTVVPGQTSVALVKSVGDPCLRIAHTFTPISIASSAVTRIISPVSAKKTYICSLALFSAGVNGIVLLEGTGGTCGSGTAGLYGGTSTGAGLALIAQSQVMIGNGEAAVIATAGTNVDLCIQTGGATQLSGVAAWVQE